MCFRLVICLLVVGAVAAKFDLPFVSKHGGFHKPLVAPGKPCCAPAQSTYDQVEFVSFEKDGKFKLDYFNYNGAYDAKEERLGFDVAYTSFDNPAVYYKNILLFKTGEDYVIIGDDCYNHTIESSFPKQCMPDYAKFFNAATLGENKIQLETWGWEVTTAIGKAYITTTADIEDGKCLPIGEFERNYDPKTNEQLHFVERRFYNYKEGIDDPDKYFKPPLSCEKARPLTKSLQAMKLLGRNRFYL